MNVNSSESQAFHAFSKIQALLSDGMDVSNFQADSSFSRDNSTQGTCPGSRYDNSHNVNDSTALIVKEPTTVSFNANINEESFENRLHPDERKFHEILQSTMCRLSDGSISGQISNDNLSQADIVTNYAAATQQKYIEVSQQSRRVASDLTITEKNNGRSGWKSTVLQRELSEVKAERDLWSLLEILTMSNLLDDINDEECDQSLDAALRALPLLASVPDFVNAAYTSDLRIRKGAVLKEWLEKSALDRVGEAPVPRAFPGSDTISRILKDRTGGNRRTSESNSNLLRSLHPDAQLAADGLLLPMDGVDRLDQEMLLKTVWQLIRSGQIPKAQQVAAEHHVYWLAASLQGVASHYHKQITLGDIGDNAGGSVNGDDDENDPAMVVGIARRGNLKQPIWTRTCWKHASRLAAHPGNWSTQSGKSTVQNATLLGRNVIKDDSLTGVLELSIYAALSNNTKVLKESPLLSTWHDHIWAYLKAAHERDLSKVIHRYRCIKSAHSDLYPGCEMSVITAERELLDWNKTEIGHMSTANCVQIFNKVPPPTSKTAESLLLKLQAAVMEGRSGILNYIENTMYPVLLEQSKASPALQMPLLLRVYCHFAIWLRYSPSDSSFTGATTTGTNMAELISDEIFYLAVESYIDHLIDRKQRTLVAAYAAYLERSRRINKYAELLRSVQASVSQPLLPQQQHEFSGQSAEAAEVLQLASIFFPHDVIDITRAVVENAHVSTANTTATRASRNVTFNEEQSRSTPQRGLLTPVRREYSNIDGDEMDEGGEDSPVYGRLSGRKATPRHVGNRSSTALNEFQSPAPESFQQLAIVTAEREGRTVPIEGGDVSDIQQMEALRWLFFDPAHRVEAVKQTNRLITAFLAESDGAKLHLVRSLLISYLPYDSVEVGQAFLTQRETELRELIEDYSSRQYVSEDDEEAKAVIEEMQSVLQLDELCWDANISKLELWRSLVGAMEDVDTLNTLLTEYSSTAGRLVGSKDLVKSSMGRYRSKIERQSTIATDALMRTVTCAEYTPGFNNPARGYRDVWTSSDSASVSSMLHLCGVVISATTQSRGRCSDNSTVSTVLKVLEDIHTVASNVFSEELQRSDEMVSRLLQMIFSLSDCVQQCSFAHSDISLKVTTAVTQIRLCLVEFSESKSVKETILNTLLSTYLKLCEETAQVMEDLGHTNVACIWHCKGIRLADVVATEEDSLRLFNILTRRDLERLLNGINDASMKLLKLDPEFNIV